MKVNYAIIPECFTDTNLVETITGLFNAFNHQKSCNQVSKTMQKNLADSFAVGIIDKDKRQIKYLEEFELVASSGDLFLYKHPLKHHYIIQIFPAVESFILKSAKEAGISLKTYGLPDDLNDLKRITKRQTSRNNPKLRRLFSELKNKNAPQIVTLSNWISYLKENNYHANTDEIINNHS
jgi:hypothetical protein